MHQLMTFILIPGLLHLVFQAIVAFENDNASRTNNFSTKEGL